jgi:phosphotransacetylase
VTRPPNFPSELGFSALLQYSPQGQTVASRASRDSVLWIKRGSPRYLARIGELCADNAIVERLGNAFGPDAPGSGSAQPAA